MAYSPDEVDFTVPVNGGTITWDHVDDSAKFFLGGKGNSRPLFIDKDGSLLGAYGGGAGSSLLSNGSWAEPSCGFFDAFNGLVCKGQVYRTGAFINIDMRNSRFINFPLGDGTHLEMDTWSNIDVQRLSSPSAPYSPRKAITYTLNQDVGYVCMAFFHIILFLLQI